ncbi:MAG: cobalamin-dependent protein [Chloroflexi bacterium]|nr:cobalamin-dependent protein [Chloroflexota bacterium]MDA8189852.1 cobalamin-dependent protein [Dehalococcoidales bacterium]
MSKELYEAIVSLEELAALKCVREEFDSGKDPLSILEECRQALEIVGQRFDAGEYFLSELILGAQIFKEAMEVISPALEDGKNEGASLGKVVIGTVKGDIHDLGKNLVAAMLKAAGFEVYDLGVDVARERFVEMVREVRPQVVGMSALLTIAFNEMRDTVMAIEAAGLRDSVKIMVGGGPVNEAVKGYVGADAVGRNASQAVELVKMFVGGK